MPELPRLSRSSIVSPLAASSSWGKWLATIWCWNEHRHQALIWATGGLGWALVCWSYVVWRSTGTWGLAKVPLCILASLGIALHFFAVVATIYVWSKIRLFTLIRVLLANLQYLVLSVLATVWIAGSPYTGYAFLTLLFLRGVLLRSWPAAVVSLLAVGTALALALPLPLLQSNQPLVYAGVGVMATGYALALGLDTPRGAESKGVGFVEAAFDGVHMAGLACLGTAAVLTLENDPQAGELLGAALVGLCPSGVHAIGAHAHAALFHNCAVAAGDLDVLEF